MLALRNSHNGNTTFVVGVRSNIMTMAKAQCKKILKQAKKACASKNYLDDKKAQDKIYAFFYKLSLNQNVMF